MGTARTLLGARCYSVARQAIQLVTGHRQDSVRPFQFEGAKMIDMIRKTVMVICMAVALVFLAVVALLERPKHPQVNSFREIMDVMLHTLKDIWTKGRVSCH